MTLPLSDLYAIAPELILVGVACLIFVLDPIMSVEKRPILAWIGLGSLVVCFGITAVSLNSQVSAFSNLLSIDPYSGFWKLLLYTISGLTILLSLAYWKEEGIFLTEYYGFLILSLVGMMIMVSAADLLVVYLGLELMSISLYILAGFKREDSRSLEASAKYFVLGAFSSAILLYGISLLFGLSGSTHLTSIGNAVTAKGLDDPTLILSMILLVVGFGFKVSAVPFHMWTPDVYEGSPTSVTTFMAIASKAASFGAILRVFMEGLAGIRTSWHILFLIICIATLAVGNIVAVVQTNIKRMLAYSSIAHAGYALIGIVVASHIGTEQDVQSFGLSSILLYLAVYSFMTLGAFAIAALIRKDGKEGTHIEDLTGLAKRQPLVAFLMLLFMVSLAGIPPTAGFIGKFYLFLAAVNAGMAWLAVIAMLFTAIGAFYYLRIVMIMYMRDPSPDALPAPQFIPSTVMAVVLVCALAGVVGFGLYPDPLLSLTSHAVASMK